MELVIANYEHARSWCRDFFCNDYFEFCFSYTSLKDRFRDRSVSLGIAARKDEILESLLRSCRD